jgi:hypothetical protein
MRHVTAVRSKADIISQPSALPTNFLNCYEIFSPSSLTWRVSTYTVVRVDGQQQTHKDRGEIKNIIWTLRKRYKDRCQGYGFVVDIDERTVALPAAWDLPSPIEVEGYSVAWARTFTTSASEPKDRPIIAGIICEAMKKHFKKNRSAELGHLWQDYDQFCQMSNEREDRDSLLCRRFGVLAKVLCGNRWVLELLVSTATLDGKTFDDYYHQGEVDVLASMIETKRANRRTRQNRPTAIRVWRDQSTEYQININALELEDPSVVIGHGTLSRREQVSLASGTVRCKPFNGSPIDVSLAEIRLVLDTQITQEEHADTIIEPVERARLQRQLRDFVDGAEMYG